MSCEGAAIPFQAHAKYETWSMVIRLWFRVQKTNKCNLKINTLYLDNSFALKIIEGTAKK